MLNTQLPTIIIQILASEMHICERSQCIILNLSCGKQLSRSHYVDLSLSHCVREAHVERCVVNLLLSQRSFKIETFLLRLINEQSEVTGSNRSHGELSHFLQRDCPGLDHALSHIRREQIPNTHTKVPPEHHVIEAQVLTNLQEFFGAEHRCEHFKNFIIDTGAVNPVFTLRLNQFIFGPGEGEKINDKLFITVPELNSTHAAKPKVIAHVSFSVETDGKVLDVPFA